MSQSQQATAFTGQKRARQNPTIVNGCPCCGAAINVRKPFVDENTNRLVYGESSIHLAGIQARLVGLLCARAPGVVSSDSLIMHAWGDEEPEDARHSLKVLLSQVRGFVRPLGLDIKNVYAVGYRLVLK